MSETDNTERTPSRRGFLRVTATGATATAAGLGAAGTATAQSDETTENGTAENGTAENESAAMGEGGGHGEKGEIVFTPVLQAFGAAIVLGVLSPIVFAIVLVMRRDQVGPSSNEGRGDANLKRIDSNGNNN